MQVAGLGQHSRLAARSQWFATVLSGSIIMGRQHSQVGSYSAIAIRRQRRGPHVRHRYRPSDTTTPHHAVPLTECRVACDKTRHAHAVKNIIYYS
jgi:hypothetical protein